MRKIRRFIRQITFDVYGHFSTDDGWAFASHIALSGLMAMFPFLIFATSLASFLGTKEFADLDLVFDGQFCHGAGFTGQHGFLFLI